MLAETFANKTLRAYPVAVNHMINLEADREYFKERGEWPDWCALPMAATYAAICGQLGMYDDMPHARIGLDKVAAMSDLTAAYLWTQTKVVFEFDATLEKVLVEQEFDGKIPWQALLRLPVPCAYIKLNDKGALHMYDERIDGFFVWLECDTQAKWPELRADAITSDGHSIQMVCPIKETLEESLEALDRSKDKRAVEMGIRKTAPLSAAAKELRSKIWKRVLNLVLYLCSDEPEYDEPPRTTPLKKSKSPRQTARTVQNVNVGVRIGADLRAARTYTTSAKTEHAGTGTPKITHVRRAHWHHFWTGTGAERKLILKWVSPIIVNPEKGEISPVIRGVKKHGKNND